MISVKKTLEKIVKNHIHTDYDYANKINLTSSYMTVPNDGIVVASIYSLNDSYSYISIANSNGEFLFDLRTSIGAGSGRYGSVGSNNVVAPVFKGMQVKWGSHSSNGDEAAYYVPYK